VVQLRYSKGNASGGPEDPDEPPPAKDALMEDAEQAGVYQESYISKDTPQPIRASEPAAAPSVTAPTFASVPAPQMPAQPAAPKVTGLPMSALLNTPEPAVQPTNQPASTPSEAPKTAQPVASNGWNGSHPSAEN
jgi:hypothetical protein